MRKMKDSGVEWIGEIPEGWKVVSTKFLFDIFSGATPDSSNPEYWEGDIRWITPADYKSSDVYVDGGRRNLSQKGFESCSTSMIPSGNIIFSKRAPIGSVAINLSELCTNQGCLACVCKGAEVAKYYYYVMSVATKQYELLGSGTTFKEISALSFANFKLPLPNNRIQNEISSYLDGKCAQIDTLIANVQTQIEKLKAYKQSLITETVTKGLDPTVPMKDSGIEWIGKVPEHWRIIRLKHLYDYSNGSPVRVGPFGSALPSSEFSNEGVWVYNQRTVLDQNFVTNNIFVSKEKASELSGFAVHPKDILITTRGSIGKTAIVPDSAPEGILHPCVIRFRIDSEKMDNALLSLIFNETNICLGQIMDMSNSTTIEVLYSYSLKEIWMPCPPTCEQGEMLERVRELIQKFDRLISLKQAKIEKLEQYKKSLIYEYVTGKKEVI